MDYLNKPCPGCGSHFREDDDIVVCPDCATPQHRSCWMENGCCVNASKHGTDFVWTPEERTIPEPAFSYIDVTPEITENGTKVCHICGSENPADSNNCGQCGAMLDRDSSLVHCNFCGFENPSGSRVCQRCGAPLIIGENVNYNPYAAAMGAEGNEIIGEHTAAELALYVRKRTVKYLDRFRQIENEKRVPFNGAAFFFGPLWMFYRKIYKAGVIFLVCIAAVSLIFAGAIEKVQPLIMEHYDEILNNTMTPDETFELGEKVMEGCAVPFTVGAGLLLVIAFICGIMGNRFYYRKILNDLKMFEKEVDDRRVRQAFIIRRGGTSFFSAFCGICTYEIISSVLLKIAAFVGEKF